MLRVGQHVLARAFGDVFWLRGQVTAVHLDQYRVRFPHYPGWQGPEQVDFWCEVVVPIPEGATSYQVEALKNILCNKN